MKKRRKSQQKKRQRLDFLDERLPRGRGTAVVGDGAPAPHMTDRNKPILMKLRDLLKEFNAAPPGQKMVRSRLARRMELLLLQESGDQS
jgi:hypothetical protein